MPIKFYLSILFLLLVQLVRSVFHILREDGRVNTEELIVNLDEVLEGLLTLFDTLLVVLDGLCVIFVIDSETEVRLGETDIRHRLINFFQNLGDSLGSVISPIVEAEELSDGMVADDFVVHMICWL